MTNLLRLICKREDGSIGIKIPCEGDKKRIEQDAENEGFSEYRWVSVENVPLDREFRSAWCDETNGNGVDIDLLKAKDIKLKQLRSKRDLALKKTDEAYIKALSLGDKGELEKINEKKQILRDCTEPLKSLQVSGYNDENILNQIRTLGEFIE